ncbi:hypothetical protein J6590_083618 [Homalodisca vitripennis]|nr:hypothetical protein J6590_083618 [Homalodisca vitripennis]
MPSLTLILGIKGLKVTSEPPPIAGRRAICKDRIAQWSPIKTASKFDIAGHGYLAMTTVPATIHSWHIQDIYCKGESNFSHKIP